MTHLNRRASVFVEIAHLSRRASVLRSGPVAMPVAVALLTGCSLMCAKQAFHLEKAALQVGHWYTCLPI